MKNLMIISVFLLLSTVCKAQDNFSFDKNGLTDYIVTPCEGKSQMELYNKCLDWISVTYKDPSKVIKSKIENEYIRIEGFSNDLVCYSYMGKRCGDTKYEIEISFKDGRYKFDVLEILEYNTPTQYRSATWTSFDLNNTSAYYDKKGEIKKSYKYIPEMIPAYFNNLNLELNAFLLSNSIPSKKSDW